MTIEGRCEVASLAAAIHGRALVVCDVEVHDAFVPGVGGRIEERFRGTHEVTRVPAEARRA